MNPRDLFIQQRKDSKTMNGTYQAAMAARGPADSRPRTDPLNLPNPTLQATEDLLVRLQGFLLGKLTWAQVEGWKPEDLYAYATIGSQLFRAGRLDQAQTVFEACESINPKDWYFPYCLAQIQIVKGDTESAIESLLRSTKSPLKRPEPHLLLAGCFLQQGDEDRAVSHLKVAKSLAAEIQKGLNDK